jgi:hypothetical protein
MLSFENLEEFKKYIKNNIISVEILKINNEIYKLAYKTSEYMVYIDNFEEMSLTIENENFYITPIV